MEQAKVGTRRQIAFYGSTPAYRPVLELHGWGGLQDDLNRLSKQGEWATMGELIDDEILNTFAVVGEPEQVGCAKALRHDRRQFPERHIQWELLKAPTVEFSGHCVANGTEPGCSIQRWRPSGFEAEEIAKVYRRSCDQVLGRRLLVICSGEVDVLRSPSPESEAKVQRESSLEHPALWNGNGEPGEKAHEGHPLS
jgi:hypothetical protein